mgnify:CR=1 FL=1
MTIPTISANPTRTLGTSAFYAEIEAAWQQLPDTIAGINASLGTVEAAALAAQGAVLAENWSAGTYPVNTRKWSTVDGLLYRRTVATASAVDPGTDSTGWALCTLPEGLLVLVSATAATCAAGGEYRFLNTAASEATLPAGPATGDTVRLSFKNGRLDNYVRRNGQLIEGRAEDMQINIPLWNRRLRFMGGADGWVVTR